MYSAAERRAKTSTRKMYSIIVPYTDSHHARYDDYRAENISLMCWNNDECTTFGLRACKRVRHNVAMIKSAKVK
jgi:hypothetical protein